jgi:formylglycine-generating enzyme required for sulfatase activity
LPKDDPDKVNSIYTRKLLPLLKTPGLPLHDLARQLRREVHDIAVAVPHVQQPAYYDGLIGKFCLAGCGGAPEPKTASPATVSSVVTPPPRQRPLYLKCAMKGGVMDGKAYSFSIDTVGRKAAWAEYGVPLEIAHLDDLRIHMSATLRIPGLPEHDRISFNFNRLALEVVAELTQPEAIRRCWTRRQNYCDLIPNLVASSSGTCELIARPEDIASVAPQPKPTPKATASPKRCDGVEATVGNERRCLGPGAGKTEWFRDCPDCPEMVVVPAGEFLMGAPSHEADRSDSEGPQSKVTIGRPFAVGRFAVTRGEFATFVAATGYNDADGGCVAFTDGAELMPNVSWRSPGFAQSNRHPVVCVGWPDAKAYVAWLSKTTGKTYRLMSESEREYVTRAGTLTPFWWGSTITTTQANYDGTAEPYKGGKRGESRKATVPVDSFAANPWGLYNVHGNADEWTEDCWNKSNVGIPGDGRARTTGDCRSRVTRGGSFINPPNVLRSAARGAFVSGSPLAGSIFNIGFRVARSLD